MAETVAFILNGRSAQSQAKGSTPLVYVLRGEMGLMGARIGCGEGHCGSCTVIVEGKAVTSCDLPLEAVAGKSVETVEGIAPDGKLHPVQQAVVDEQGFQCAFCMPGFVMATVGFPKVNPSPTRAELAHGVSGNLCRCQDYDKILTALMKGAENLRKVS
ncbi:MAG: (2Fe-2S)-binding protein [Usitatibacter sp.]